MYNYLTEYYNRNKPVQFSPSLDKVLWANRLDSDSQWNWPMKVWRRNEQTQEITYLGEIDLKRLPDTLPELKKWVARFVDEALRK